MNIQAHPGLKPIGIEMPRSRRRPAVRAGRPRVGRRAVTVLAAVAIEVIVAVAFVAMSVGVGGEQRAGSSRPGAAPFVTPAPEPAPTPAPGY